MNLCFSPDRDCFTKCHSTEGARVRAWVKENGRKNIIKLCLILASLYVMFVLAEVIIFNVTYNKIKEKAKIIK